MHSGALSGQPQWAQLKAAHYTPKAKSSSLAGVAGRSFFLEGVDLWRKPSLPPSSSWPIKQTFLGLFEAKEGFLVVGGVSPFSGSFPQRGMVCLHAV